MKTRPVSRTSFRDSRAFVLYQLFRKLLRRPDLLCFVAGSTGGRRAQYLRPWQPSRPILESRCAEVKELAHIPRSILEVSVTGGEWWNVERVLDKRKNRRVVTRSM